MRMRQSRMTLGLSEVLVHPIYGYVIYGYDVVLQQSLHCTAIACQYHMCVQGGGHPCTCTPSFCGRAVDCSQQGSCQG